MKVHKLFRDEHATMYLSSLGILLMIWDRFLVKQVICNNQGSVFTDTSDELKYEKACNRTLKGFIIFPGTKWCGTGNVADNVEDLGAFTESDKCCRTHDNCDDFIGGFKTKHNLTNPSFYTRLNCKCDAAFFNCLKAIKSVPSRSVGYTYFTKLGTKCFSKEYPIIRCLKHSVLPKRRCLEYKLNNRAPKVYQWFDVPLWPSLL